MEKIFRPSPNSFKNTFCVFHEVPMSSTNGLVIQYQSKAGSTYYYTKEGMYRVSNHWGRLANSKWRLVPLQPETPSKFKVGYAKWEAFFPDNAQEDLYYLEVNYLEKTVHYQHRNNSEYDKKAVLRTSFLTVKKIKQIRNLFALTSWAKYFDYNDIEELRKKIIDELIYTDKPLEEIKRELSSAL